MRRPGAPEPVEDRDVRERFRQMCQATERPQQHQRKTCAGQGDDGGCPDSTQLLDGLSDGDAGTAAEGPQCVRLAPVGGRGGAQ